MKGELIYDVVCGLVIVIGVIVILCYLILK
jgi:hypothetical protein